MRTHYCGATKDVAVGETVTICGWVDRRRDHGGVIFLDMRDREGIVQVVFDPDTKEYFELADRVRSEYVLQITGRIRNRAAETVNPAMATGHIEILGKELVILNEAAPPPFPLDAHQSVGEDVRLRYRFMDLRRDSMQRNLISRSRITSTIRTYLESAGFLDIETPVLTRATPEGARDYLVPSRTNASKFFALPQSPQLFKQLCMVGGIDRYYQIARCLRDEDLRADRQFEFMQLDAEMSFVNQEDVFTAIGHAVANAAEAVTGDRPSVFPRMTWLEAQERFGSDKPDTRFGMELVELTSIFEGTEARVFQAPCVKGIRMEGGVEALSRNQIDALVETCQRWGAKGLAWMKVIAGDSGPALDAGVAKFLSDTESSAVIDALDAVPGDMVFLVADERRVVRHVLGLLRLELGKPPVNEGGLHFLWIVDFPLFETIADNGMPVPAHHPFTMPHEDDWGLLEQTGEALLEVRSQSYDLVLNGWELGSGSIRINRSDVQNRIFELLGIGEQERQAKFGFFIDAFRYGAPPHGGFAFGTDRLVALLAGETNIREVIAFPKTQSGADPLTNAPSAIDAAHLDELGLRVLPPAT